MLRGLVCLLCVASLLACSTQSTLPAATAADLANAQEGEDGTVKLVDENGGGVHLRPGDKLKVTLNDGVVTEVPASRVCRSAEGLSMRAEKGSCAEASWIGTWDEVASINVDQFDGASTVAVSTAAAVIVVGIIVVVASSKGGGSGVGSVGAPGAGKGKAKPDAPKANGAARSGHTVATPSRGGRAGAAGAAAPVAPSPWATPHARRGRSYNVGLMPRVVLNTAGSYEPPPSVDELPALVAAPVDARPLFSSQAQRRAYLQPSLRFDVGGCVSMTRCHAESLKIGLLMGDLFELSAGGRWEQFDGKSSLLGVMGLGLQGKFTSAPSLALALNAQFAFGGSTVRMMSSAGLRIRPSGDIWMGLQPLALTYFQTESKLAYTPSLDLGYVF